MADFSNLKQFRVNHFIYVGYNAINANSFRGSRFLLFFLVMHFIMMQSLFGLDCFTYWAKDWQTIGPPE